MPNGKQVTLDLETEVKRWRMIILRSSPKREMHINGKHRGFQYGWTISIDFS